MDVSLKVVMAEWEERYPYYHQEGTDKAKCDLGWHDARDFICKVQCFDSDIQ